VETPGRIGGIADSLAVLAADQSPAADQQDLHFLLIRGTCSSAQRAIGLIPREGSAHPPGHVFALITWLPIVLCRDLRACVARYRE